MDANTDTQHIFEPLIDSEYAASLLQVHSGTLLRWARAKFKEIPHHRLGRKVMFRASELNAWLSSGYTDSAVRAAQL
jgi:excisionase family DNA binding protein